MTHKELLAKIDYYLEPTIKMTGDDRIKNSAIGFMKALRAVVELHKPSLIPDWVPTDKELMCWCSHIYPCPTIRTIEKELQ